MFSTSLLAYFLYSASVHALPTDNAIVTSTSHIEKRNPCDGVNAEPILYHDYKNDVCPPRNKFTAPGQCQMQHKKVPGWNPFRGVQCAGYCEENVKYKYGQEVMFLANPYCHGPMTCAIADTQTTAWAFSLNIPISEKFTDAFTFGITGGLTYTSTTARAVTKTVNLKQNECGYFTWIPVMKESCGTLTADGTYKDIAPGHPEGLCSNGKTVKPNTCTTMPTISKGSKNDPAGVTVLVRVDCRTHAPLPKEFQDAAYNQPGVPLDRGVYNSFAEIFEDQPKFSALTSDIDCKYEDTSKMAVKEDCMAALAGGMMHPIVGLMQGKKGGQWWASYVHSCAFQIEYEQDWNKDCLVGLAETMKAAAEIMNTCKTVDGKIGGKRKIRNDGKCNATLRLAATDGRKPPQDMSPLVG